MTYSKMFILSLHKREVFLLILFEYTETKGGLFSLLDLFLLLSRSYWKTDSLSLDCKVGSQ